jgi:hypothetical protein
MTGLMFRFGTAHSNALRKAVGVAYYQGRKKEPPAPIADSAELEKLISSTHPIELSAIGIVGLLVISWLMVFEPF